MWWILFYGRQTWPNYDSYKYINFQMSIIICRVAPRSIRLFSGVASYGALGYVPHPPLKFLRFSLELHKSVYHQELITNNMWTRTLRKTGAVQHLTWPCTRGRICQKIIDRFSALTDNRRIALCWANLKATVAWTMNVCTSCDYSL